MYICLENVMKNGDKSLYRLTLTAAARANELVQGAQPLVKTTSKKVSAIALQEIAAGKVRYEEIKSTRHKKAS